MLNGKLGWALGLCVFIAACGGGGGGGETDPPATASSTTTSSTSTSGGGGSTTPPPASTTPNPDRNTAAGQWSGYVFESTAAESYAQNELRLVVLPDGHAWGVYFSGDPVNGAVAGQITGRDTRALSDVTEYLEGKAVRRATFGLVDVSEGSTYLTFMIDDIRPADTVQSKTPPPATAQAGLAALAGEYTVNIGSTHGTFNPMRLSLDNAGQLHAQHGECSIDGALSARADVTDTFDAKFTITGVCTLETGLGFQGVVFLSAPETGTTRLVGVGVSADGTDALYLAGPRFVAPPPAPPALP